MPIAPPAAAIALAPGVAGNPGEETAGMVALTPAQLLVLVTDAIAECPETEPVAPGVLWINNGVLALSVGIPPVITDQPDSLEATAGDNVTFTVVATNATSYQWSRNTGSGWAVVSGATSASLILSSVDETMDGYQYRCLVTGLGGSVTSNTATLTFSNLDEYYTVSGFSDSNYFESAANAGLNSLGTVRLVFRLLSVPAGSLKFICGKIDNAGAVGGWYFRTGTAGAGSFNCYVVTSTGAQATPSYTLASGDIGSIFVAHATISGGRVRLYVGGTQVGSTACGTPTSPTSAEKLGVGKWQYSTGISSGDVAIVSLATSTAALTDQQISDDASQIMGNTSRFDAADLPSQTERWDAIDIGAAWVSRGPGTLSLAKTGTPTITGPL